MAQEQIKQQNEETTVVSGDWFLMQKASTDETVKVDAGNIVPDGAISYIKLLSTIFSGQVTTDTNPGTAGGTRNKLNLGGVKLSWGKTGAYLLAAGGGAIGTITFPTSHFTAAPTVFYSLTELTTSGRQYPYESAAPSTTTSTPAVINETGGTVGGKLNWFAIGV